MPEGMKLNVARRKKNFGGWIAFVAVLLVFSLGASPYHKIADSALIAVRLSLVLLLSALVIWERWNHRRDVPGGRGSPYDRGESILERMRRWYYDEPSK
jgi:hypothetical protein